MKIVNELDATAQLIRLKSNYIWKNNENLQNDQESVSAEDCFQYILGDVKYS